MQMNKIICYSSFLWVSDTFEDNKMGCIQKMFLKIPQSFLKFLQCCYIISPFLVYYGSYRPSRPSVWRYRAKKMSPQCAVQAWHLTLRVESIINAMVFMECETVLQTRSLFTPTTTELTLTPGHCWSSPGTAWLLTPQSASWTNITWIQFSCNHFPSSIHCVQLVLRRFALAKNCDFFSPFIFLTIPNPAAAKKTVQL